MEAEARGIYSQLSHMTFFRPASDLESKGRWHGMLLALLDSLFSQRMMVESCGGPQEAFRLLMLDHMDKLAETSAKAISNIKFDKVVVWDGGSKDGTGATANFLRSLATALPPTMHMMKDIGGVELPQVDYSINMLIN